MTLFARSIALQGFTYTPIALAVQGLIAMLEQEQEEVPIAPGGINKKKPTKRELDQWADNYVRNINAQAKAALERQVADEEAIIMTVVQFVLEEA
jgi:hypothetical protein